MKKWNLVIDVERCMDCNNCFLADKDEFTDNDFPPYSVAQPWSGHRWMNILRKERGQYPLVQVAYLPTPCLHCDDAPCIKDSPAGTVYKREDGLVIIDPLKAKGHPEIVKTCPYEVIYWNDEAQVAQKCTGCAHLLEDGWANTRCSQVCPTDAISLVLADDAEMTARVAAEGLEVLKPELHARPRVYYKNLHLWTKAFIAGQVVFADTDECGEGAVAAVTQGGRKVGEATADNYGDFYVDGLEPVGEYTLTVSASGYVPATQTIKLDQSLTIGTVSLPKVGGTLLGSQQGGTMNDAVLNMLGIAGSLRAGSYNLALLRAAAGLVPAGVSLEIVTLEAIPLYNADAQSKGDPEPVEDLKRRIMLSDVLLIATPEYNYSIPGVLKNAIDWASRPPKTCCLRRKPVGIVGASSGESGTIRSQLALRQVFVFTDCLVMAQPELRVTNAGQRFDERGTLIDQELSERLRAYLAALVEWTRLVGSS